VEFAKMLYSTEFRNILAAYKHKLLWVPAEEEFTRKHIADGIAGLGNARKELLDQFVNADKITLRRTEEIEIQGAGGAGAQQDFLDTFLKGLLPDEPDADDTPSTAAVAAISGGPPVGGSSGDGGSEEGHVREVGPGQADPEGSPTSAGEGPPSESEEPDLPVPAVGEAEVVSRGAVSDADLRGGESVPGLSGGDSESVDGEGGADQRVE
jgi:hypothetical protein